MPIKIKTITTNNTIRIRSGLDSSSFGGLKVIEEVRAGPIRPILRFVISYTLTYFYKNEVPKIHLYSCYFPIGSLFSLIYIVHYPN